MLHSAQRSAERLIIMAIDAIARNKAEALIREQLVNTIQQDVPKSSIVMQLGTRLANMTSNQTKIPVLSMLPLATGSTATPA